MKNWKKFLAAVFFPLSLVSAVSQTVTVTTPNGGQTWTAGSTYSITWTITGNTASINYQLVALSTDGGSTYNNISVAQTPGTRSFNWTIPSGTSSSLARIRVRALDVNQFILAQDASDSTFTISATSSIPASPTSLTAVGNASSIGLSWTDNANNEQGFYIERKVGAGGTFAYYDAVGANVTSYTDFSVSVGTTYYYRVYAYNAAGYSAFYSNEASAAPTGTVPASPTSLTAVGNASSIGLSWTDNANNEQGFYIERKVGAGGTFAYYDAVGANVTTYTDSSVSVGTTYYYRVYAYNAAGSSPFYSNEAFASPTGNLPAPTLNAPADASTGQSTTPTFSWSAVAGADSGYRIMVATSAADLPTDPTASTGGASVIINATPATTSYTPSTPLNAGTTYYWEVHGRSSAQFGTWSSVRSFTTSPLAGGSWTQLATPAPGGVGLMLLLSDGTVMAASRVTDQFENPPSSGSRIWYRLTPDIHGSYANGTWTTLPSMHDTRLWFSSDVLKDGRVFVAGAEYGTGRATAELYDPTANTPWTQINPPTSLLNPAIHSPVLASTGPDGNQGFSDSVSKILPNGNVLVAPVGPYTGGGTLLYNPNANTWSAGPFLYRGVYQDEASWVKLPDDSILTIDPFGTSSERYIPSSNTWANDGVVPVSLYDSIADELGAAFLLPNGRVFFLGASGHTALYIPTGNTSPGSWIAGPDIPNGLVAADAPAAMMVNGKILCAVAPVIQTSGVFPPPTSFYEYDYAVGSTGSFTQVASPIGGLTDNTSSYQTLMLDLPDGTVLYSHFGNDLYVYQPIGLPLSGGKPTISSITQNVDTSYHLTGTLLNGISEGAAYGDDAQMNGNYPLVRVTNPSGNVYYERTYNWSSTSVMTGNTTVTTEFTNSAALSPGTYSLVVVANGISSDPFSFTVPSPKSNQTITFAPLANKTIGEPPFAVSATASSGLSVDFSILSGSATYSGNNVTLTGTDTVTVRASQGGNSSYNPAPSVDQSFTVYAPPQAGVNMSGNKFIISWPINVAGFVLQSTPSLNPASWSTVSPSPVIVNGQFTVTNDATSGNMFYRLQK